LVLVCQVLEGLGTQVEKPAGQDGDGFLELLDAGMIEWVGALIFGSFLLQTRDDSGDVLISFAI